MPFERDDSPVASGIIKIIKENSFIFVDKLLYYANEKKGL